MTKFQAVTNSVHNLQVGDIIEFRKYKHAVVRIKVTGKPEFSPHWGRWYVPGSRFVKKWQRFAKSELLFSFVASDLLSYERE